VIAPDLPGHGFTTTPESARLSLPGMAHDLGRLLRELDCAPAVAVGHSAGAAILLRMAIDRRIRPEVLIGLNAAILPIRGAPIFSPLAKLLFRNPIAPKVFALRAQGGDATRRLLEGTGSHLDERGIELYARLFRHSGHVAATLGMMANWDLPSLVADLPRLACPLMLLAATDDKAVPPADSQRVAEKVAKGRSEVWPAGGHLLHETRPAEVAARIKQIAREHGALSPC
jgi:magnesium chelatase accessory protein